MKIALILLGLLGVLHANPLNYDSPDEFETFVEPKPEEVLNVEEEVAAAYPNKSRPPQIHHNTVKFQAPFAGSLINILLNEKGVQETAQKNQIAYNMNGF